MWVVLNWSGNRKQGVRDDGSKQVTDVAEFGLQVCWRIMLKTYYISFSFTRAAEFHFLNRPVSMCACVYRRNISWSDPSRPPRCDSDSQRLGRKRHVILSYPESSLYNCTVQYGFLDHDTLTYGIQVQRVIKKFGVLCMSWSNPIPVTSHCEVSLDRTLKSCS
ncbi:hypothetical protein PILCRDRAFT_200491 [Piloderma croceum F 1598]|uniref:Uncharacterized protein n=1 Tax=Piloderma croceum (strain F 1598) TaxID=765440 RepID=A0A0C3GDX4_PILCF|nr:hypothetical protein PILCRDRAFT_200491 [Piloderma croceum F 1598]